MSVVRVITKSRGTGGRADSSGRRGYALRFQAVTNDLADEAQTVGLALGFEPFDEYHFGNGSDALCHAKSIEIERSSDSPYIWDIDVEFDNQVEDWDQNPFLRPTVVDYGFVQNEEVYWVDVFGNPVTYSNRLYCDPPLTRDQSRLHITMTRNELVFPFLTALAYQDSTNSDVWFGCGIGQAKVMNISGKFTKESGFSFYECVYEFQIRREGWTQQPLNQGLVQRNGKPCTEKDGNTPVNEPVPLDEDGMQLAWPLDDPEEITYQTFYPYLELPFAALALP
jgi:hypothetical protein